MSCLKEATYELATGDPVHCAGCQSFFNIHSQLVQEGDA